MNLSKTIQSLEEKILNDINSSGLHPSISKLILLNIIKNIEDYERKETLNNEEQKE